jgi:hypothetical protein
MVGTGEVSSHHRDPAMRAHLTGGDRGPMAVFGSEFRRDTKVAGRLAGKVGSRRGAARCQSEVAARDHDRDMCGTRALHLDGSTFAQVSAGVHEMQRRPPEPCAQVRVLLGVLSTSRQNAGRPLTRTSHSGPRSTHQGVSSIGATGRETKCPIIRATEAADVRRLPRPLRRSSPWLNLTTHRLSSCSDKTR